MLFLDWNKSWFNRRIRRTPLRRTWKPFLWAAFLCYSSNDFYNCT